MFAAQEVNPQAPDDGALMAWLVHRELVSDERLREISPGIPEIIEGIIERRAASAAAVPAMLARQPLARLRALVAYCERHADAADGDTLLDRLEREVFGRYVLHYRAELERRG